MTTPITNTESSILQDSPIATSAIPVCHVSMNLTTGGLERLLVDFAQFGDRSRFSPHFVALNDLGQPADEIRDQGLNVQTMRFGTVGKWKMLQQLAELMRNEGVQLVHTHNTYAHFYGTLAARLAEVPLVVNTQHGAGCGSTWKHRLQFRIANRWTQRIVGVSEDCAQACRTAHPKSADKTICIYNGIDLSRFNYRGPCLSGDRPTAISVARLSPEKDLQTLLRAVTRVLWEVPNFRLLIVGDGPEHSMLVDFVKEKELEGHVEFLGERSDVPELLASAGFFVTSSKTEGISLTLLEAAAVGLPIVATSVGGNPEIVQHGKTGRITAPENPGALARAMIEMCRDRDAWQAMGELGRQRVEQHFEVRRMVRDYEAVYAELLGR